MKNKVIELCPSAQLRVVRFPDDGINTSEEEFEIWFDRGNDNFEVIGGGQTPELAWQEAFAYLSKTSKERW